MTHGMLTPRITSQGKFTNNDLKLVKMVLEFFFSLFDDTQFTSEDVKAAFSIH